MVLEVTDVYGWRWTSGVIILSWFSLLPLWICRRVREAERFSWLTTRGVNEEDLLSNLPEDLQRDIRRYFFRFLNKVCVLWKLMQYFNLFFAWWWNRPIQTDSSSSDSTVKRPIPIPIPILHSTVVPCFFTQLMVKIFEHQNLAEVYISELLNIELPELLPGLCLYLLVYKS